MHTPTHTSNKHTNINTCLHTNISIYNKYGSNTYLDRYINKN